MDNPEVFSIDIESLTIDENDAGVGVCQSTQD